MSDDVTGLVRVERLCRDRSARARELAGEGRKVIGYLCGFVPPELITAAGMVPYRIAGAMGEPLNEALDYFEPNACSYVLNCFQQAITGRYDFLDGIVIPHACDTVQRLFGLWKFWRPPAYAHFLNVPTTVTDEARRFFREELEMLRESLQRFGGVEITDARIRDALAVHDENRRLVGELYAKQREEPPALSGSEMTQILLAGTALPAEEFQVFLREIAGEMRGSRDTGERGATRVLLYGCIVDDAALARLIEAQGGSIVADDTCLGMRTFGGGPPVSADPLDELCRRYFAEFLCPKVVRSCAAERFSYLVETARAARADGIIAYLMAWCDPHKFDVPVLRDYLAAAGYPLLTIEDDYTLASSGAIATRIQAFLEMLQHR